MSEELNLVSSNISYLEVDLTLLDTYNKAPTRDIDLAELCSIILNGCYVWVAKPKNAWYQFNGKVWQEDIHDNHGRAIIDILKGVYNYFSNKINHMNLSEKGEIAERKQLDSFGNNIRTIRFIKQVQMAMRNLMSISIDMFDKDQYLLNVQNGVVDLKTKELLPHKADYFMLKICSCDYNPKRKSRFWEDTIYNFCGGWDWSEKDQLDLYNYIQKAIGFSVLGTRNTEQSFYFVYGNGRTGKSTLIDNCVSVLGDYASAANPLALINETREGSKERTLEYILNKRMVSFNEIPECKHINGSFVKSITGDKSIETRKLFDESRQEDIKVKPWITSNWEIGINPQDDALWRRIKVIIMNKTKPEPPSKERYEFMDKLEQVKEDILNWIVEGAYLFLKERLITPECVINATEKMRSGQDIVSEFVNECLEKKKGIGTEIRKIYEAWRTFSINKGEYVCNETNFKEKLGKAGYIVYSTEFGKYLKGYAVKKNIDYSDNQRKSIDRYDEDWEDEVF